MSAFRNDPPLRPETLALDAGLTPDPVTGAIAPNISTSVNNVLVPGDGAFSADGVDDLTALPFLYARWTNPTVRQLEQRVAALEGTDDALASATGIAALAAIFFTFLKSGDHLIIPDVSYAGGNEMARRVLPDYGIEVSAVNLADLDAVRAAIRPETRLIHAETPCNPILRLTDLAALAAIAKEVGALLSVDSTFATPVATRPLDFGADLVLHSLTKYMNGHGDALGGVVAGPKALIEKMRSRAGVYLGASLSAQNAWLIMRGMDTLFPRVKAMSEAALKIATWLEGHPQVTRVIYPGLESHPQFALARQQMKVFSGMIAFQVREPGKVALRLAKECRVIHYAFSLGHQRSIAVFLKTADLLGSSFAVDGKAEADYRRFAGDGIFRFSVGLEAVEDILEDLQLALGE